jgi:FMN phosphatase YigB (HAD superfamily)
MLPAIAFDLGNTLVPFGPTESEMLMNNLYDMARVSDRSIGRSVFRDSYAAMVRQETVLRDRGCWESDPVWRAKGICSDLMSKGIRTDSLEHDLVTSHPMAFSRCLVFPERSISILERLRGMGVKLALVSNAMDGKGIRISLREQGVEPLLDPIIVSEELGIAKPHPRIFRKALEGLRVKASECAYVGDRYEIDVVGAKVAGMYPIYTTEYGTEGEPPEGADLSVPTIRDIGELLPMWG